MTDNNASAIIEQGSGENGSGYTAFSADLPSIAPTAEPMTDAQKIEAAVAKAKAEQEADDAAKRAGRKGRRAGKAQRIDHPTYEEWVEARKPSSENLMTILGMQMESAAKDKPGESETDKTEAAMRLAEKWREMQIFALSKSLTAWSLCNDDGSPKPISIDAIRECEFDFVGDLYDEMASQGFFG